MAGVQPPRPELLAASTRSAIAELVDGAWRTGAACRQLPGWFDLEDQAQLYVCQGCPVREACLQAVLAVERVSPWMAAHHVIYGGRTGKQRASLLRAAARRRQKTAAA